MNRNDHDRIRRALCLLMVLVLSIAALSACDTTKAPEMTTEVTETEHITTEAQTETEEITTAVVTEAVTEAVTESPILEDDGALALPVILPENAVLDPLTGLECSEEKAQRRPVAIMINNIKDALPQQQISAASVLYECEVEGGITRLLGVYNEYSDLKAIGSVRSAREYYLDFAANHDAIYVHAGGSDSAYVHFKNRSSAHIDGVNGPATGFFYRDPNRAHMRYEHRLVIDGDRLDEAIAFMRYRTTYKSTFSNPLHFVGPTQSVSLAGGKDANEITVQFGYHQTHFSYDAESNTYLRYQNGQPHIDSVNENQLAYENVLTLFCPYTKTMDTKNHITVDDVGTGKGYYMTGGKYVEIQWSKKTADSAFVLTYASGREVYLTPGKTNIEIVHAADRVTVES